MEATRAAAAPAERGATEGEEEHEGEGAAGVTTRVPECEGARVPGCSRTGGQGARVPGCEGGRGEGARVREWEGARVLENRVPECEGARVPRCSRARCQGAELSCKS